MNTLTASKKIRGIDISKKRFGRLIALRPTEKRHPSTGSVIWECACDCGKTHLASCAALRNRIIESCGCSKRPNLIGTRFGRLIVVSDAPARDGARYWQCACDCGGESIVSTESLKAGNTKSCGCLQAELRKKGRFIHGDACGSHLRIRPSREYSIWSSMKKRCINPRSNNFKYYGGRGIKVCDVWFTSFAAFLRDMGRAPVGHSIDRIDNDGNYEPGNCRWATSKTQRLNQRQRQKNHTR